MYLLTYTYLNHNKPYRNITTIPYPTLPYPTRHSLPDVYKDDFVFDVPEVYNFKRKSSQPYYTGREGALPDSDEALPQLKGALPGMVAADGSFVRRRQIESEAEHEKLDEKDYALLEFLAKKYGIKPF